ncbi:hypothetical protein, partial [Salmonella sp. s51933]|uniref:hypothetical protein n=1 Tax=Salmonella sp. s51933 TaxID=3160127 RepID=UPI0037540400
ENIRYCDGRNILNKRRGNYALYLLRFNLTTAIGQCHQNAISYLVQDLFKCIISLSFLQNSH